MHPALRLTARLADDARRLPAPLGHRQADAVRGFLHPSGLFTDRFGRPDLYYTRFALQTLRLAGEDAPAAAAAAVRGALAGAADIPGPPEAFGLLEAAALGGTAGGGLAATASVEAARRGVEVFRTHRRAEGFARHPDGPASVYITFLARLLLSSLADHLAQVGAMARFAAGWRAARTMRRLATLAAAWSRELDETALPLLAARRCTDGGFSDLSAERRGGTNPTAAALALLHGLGDATSRAGWRDAACAFLRGRQRSDGGWEATAGAPAADGLSTFTGLFALRMENGLAGLRLGAAARFVRRLALPGGGFRGGAGDGGTDTEFTYYGYATLALLAGAAAKTDPDETDPAAEGEEPGSDAGK